MVHPFQRSVYQTMCSCFFIVLFAASVFAAPANTPPPESTSKVKRVLLYNKVGGWVTVAGIANVNQCMASLAQAKGFELDTLSDDSGITLEFLKQYQVIVWNNNTNGAQSVPALSARDAIVDYVHQGGGWFLIGLAGDHANSWPTLTEIMGASVTGWAAHGHADLQVDSPAQKHPELRFVVSSIPHTIRLNDIWMAFDRTVRSLPQTTVLYTSQNGETNVLRPPADGSGDRAYVWARAVEKGKVLFCPSGWAPGSVQPSPIAQADSAVAKLYWNSMRWLAGDFQNGCTDPTSPHFNPGARVDDGSCNPSHLRIDRQMGGKSGSRQTKRTMVRKAAEMASLPSLIPSIKGVESSRNRDIRGKWIFGSHDMQTSMEKKSNGE